MALIAGVFLIQGGLISGLLHERRRRRLAEVESRQRLAELAHVNRYSAVGELTTSIAHELNQPLGSILTNAETAELMLKSSSPNLDEVGEILADIRRDDQRASEVIRRLRSVLKKTPFEMKDIDLNETVRQAIGFVTALADGRDIALKYAHDLGRAARQGRCRSIATGRSQSDHQRDGRDIRSGVQESAKSALPTSPSGASAEIRIGDTGPGIAAGDLEERLRSILHDKAAGHGHGTCDRPHHRRGPSRHDIRRKPAVRRRAFHDQASDRPRSINFGLIRAAALLLRRKQGGRGFLDL